ncbi:transposase [Chitinivorax sp. B]|uniref:transposase n=1 Tax=Chitinivorax sp. B TaxID=2502235 RepID=UPI0010F64A11|nr:transposase [Chitinivorax sp. B]
MQKKPYSPEFKEQALLKVRQRGAWTIESVAQELNMPFTTLKGWMKERLRKPDLALEGLGRDWFAEQRLQALLESHALSEPELHAWCREKGLFVHQLPKWREDFCKVQASPSQESQAALRELQNQHTQLQRELRYKEKAFAEAAALLVLQKKFQALFGDEGK